MILIFLCLIHIFSICAKNIYILLCYSANDQLTTINADSKTYSVYAGTENGAYYYDLIGFIGERFTFNVKNTVGNVGLAAVMVVGTSKFYIHGSGKGLDTSGWNTGYSSIGVSMFLIDQDVDFVGKKAALIDTYSFPFKMPIRTYCANVYPNKIAPLLICPFNNTCSLSSMLDLIYPLAGFEPQIKISTSINGTITKDSVPISSASFYDVNALIYTATTYKGDLLKYTAISSTSETPQCEYPIRICYISCGNCQNNMIVLPTEIDHKCDYENCRAGYMPVAEKRTNCLGLNKTHDYYYYNITTKYFEKCYSSCLRCYYNGDSTNHNCLICKPGTSLYEDKPDSSCYSKPSNDGYYYIKEENKYYNCFNTCGTCIIKGDSNSHNCLTCVPGFAFYADELPQTCHNISLRDNTNYYHDVSTNTYHRCYFSCFTCSAGINRTSHNCDTCQPSFYWEPSTYKSCERCYETCKSCHQAGHKTIQNCNICINDHSFYIGKEDLHNCLVNTNDNSGYYYNPRNNTYMQCYPTCGSCIEPGDNIHHKCLTCPSGDVFNPVTNDNCMTNCSRFWQANEYNEYSCANECKNDHSYLLLKYKQCVEGCSLELKYHYNHICYDKCPPNTLSYLDQPKCYPNLTDEEVMRLANDTEYIDENIFFLYHFHNITLTENKTFTIYDTSTGINKTVQKEHNLPDIELGECENQLKQIYNIPKNEPLLIFIKNTKKADNPIDNIEYMVYTSSDNIKLDISLCITNPEVSMPIKTNNSRYLLAEEFNKLGVDVYDPEDPFFNSPCETYTSKEGYDIPRSDRVDMFFQNNATMCPSGCKLNEVDYEVSAAKCKCDKQPEEKNAFDTLKSSMLSSLLNGNWDVSLCYDRVFDWKIVINNIGSWLIIIITLCFIANMIYYMVTTVNPIRNHLGNLYIESIDERQQTIKEKTKYVQGNINIEINNPTNKIQTIDINNFVLKPKNPKIKDQSNRPLNYNNPNTTNKDAQSLARLTNNHIHQEKNKYTVDDYKDMEFPILYKKDYRTFIKHYWCYLQLTHPILNTFYTMSKRELRSIKIASFIGSFVISFTLSAFFYSDIYISNNNKNNGTIDFMYNLPISIYTCVIGGIIGIGLKLLSDSETRIRKIEDEQQTKRLSKETFLYMLDVYLKVYKKKIIVYFIIQMILLVLFWYYTSAFCSVYINSQWDWFISGMISTAMDLAIPFGISIIYTINIEICLRYNLRCLYKVMTWILSFLG